MSRPKVTGVGTEAEPDTGKQSIKTETKRLSVNINAETAAILEEITSTRGISTTEAIRRAVGLMKFIDELQSSDAELIVEKGESRKSYVFHI